MSEVIYCTAYLLLQLVTDLNLHRMRLKWLHQIEFYYNLLIMMPTSGYLHHIFCNLHRFGHDISLKDALLKLSLQSVFNDLSYLLRGMLVLNEKGLDNMRYVKNTYYENFLMYLQVGSHFTALITFIPHTFL